MTLILLLGYDGIVTYPKKLFLFFLLVSTSLTIGLSSYLKSNLHQPNHNTSTSPDVLGQSTTDLDNLPAYKDNEVLVKLSQSIALSSQNQLDTQPASIASIGQDMPNSLAEINQKYSISTVEKVFKGVADPQTQLETIESLNLTKKELQN